MATLQQLEQALVGAHRAGDMNAARMLAAAVKAAREDIGNRIPGAQVPATLTKPAEQTLVDKAIGTGEAALSAITGVVGGTLGMVGGGIGGAAAVIGAGKFGTPEGANMIEQAAGEGAQALTYAPRTESGQEQAAALGGAMQNLIPVAAVAPALAIPGAAARAPGPAGVLARAGVEGVARDAANLVARPLEAVGAVAPGAAGAAAAGTVATAGNMAATGAARVAGMARTATTLPRRALEALRGTPEDAAATPGTMGSVGAAGTDMAMQRRALAESFPVPLKLTKGMETRDPAQLKFEVETAKIPDAGAPLRQRLTQINEGILANFDHWSDQTGAQAPTLRATGTAVDQALVAKAARAKTEVRTRYKAAEKAGEMEDPVALATVVQHLNESAPESATAPLLTTARAKALQLGLAVEGADGTLIPQPVTLKTAELFRQTVNRATDYEPTNIRQSTILKGLVDEATAGLGGDLYRAARSARARYAQEFEDHAVIAKLLTRKRGTTDRQVAFEDVFKHSVLDGSLDDVRTVRKVLQTGGTDGQQAWRELQGATLRHVRDEATKSVALDSAGNRVMSPAALDRAITALDADGKLDFVFGKKGAQQMRDIRELAQIAKTVPPEAAINFSNTAATLLGGVADIAAFGMSGAPVPLFTMGKLTMQYVKDAKLRNRINDALGVIEKKAPGRQRPPVGDPTPDQPRPSLH